MNERYSMVELPEQEKKFKKTRLVVKGYEIIHPLGHKSSDKLVEQEKPVEQELPVEQEKPVDHGAENREEWLNLAKAKLELVRDKAEMEEVIAQFNSHFDYPHFQQSQTLNLHTEAYVSVPEGDFKIRRNFGNHNGVPTEELIPLPLPDLRLGEIVSVRRSSGEIDPGWKIIEFKIKDTDYSVERRVVVEKQIGNESFTKTVSPKTIREING